MEQTQTLLAAIEPGKVYRRKDLLKVSKSADRCLRKLVRDGAVQKLSQGMYMRPRQTAFGPSAPDEAKLLKTFLKTNRFFVLNPSAFNSLGLGITQLYNTRIVINSKRHGELKLGGRKFVFHRRDGSRVPKTGSREVLVVEMLNRIRDLAEDDTKLMHTLQRKLHTFDRNKLKDAVERYGTYSTTLKFEQLVSAGDGS
jgi:hypothetical protein